MLEDDFTWVVRKALKGMNLAPAEAAVLAGLPGNEVLAFLKGGFSGETARKLAPVLGLNPDALARHDQYDPLAVTPPSIHRLELPFSGDGVNAWLLTSGNTHILFDTGHEPTSCINALGVTRPDEIFITHAHHDHIGGVPTFLARGHFIRDAGSMKPGDSVRCGPLTVRACDLSGHADPSLGYHVAGLSVPILVTGDALFAGSIGGCATPELYQRALANLRAVLSPLPDDTVLLPGHGPATTLGEERFGNPFL